MTDQPTKTPAERPGVQSTEFWLSLIVVIGGAIVTQYDGEPWVRVVAAIVSGLTALGYGASRAMVKRLAAAKPQEPK